MGIEVDVLSVGNGDAGCGDAIAIRISGAERSWIVVVDGGYSADGEALVGHVQENFNTKVVDLLISTHPDCDHCTGLCTIVENLDVHQVWMHRPWNYSAIASLFHDGKILPGRIRDRLRSDLESARRLDTLCSRKGIPVIEPFAGQKWGDAITVLGPSEAFYATKVAAFDCLPAPPARSIFLERLAGIGAAQTPMSIQALIDSTVYSPYGSFAPTSKPRSSILPKPRPTDTWAADNLGKRTHEVSPENQTSVVLWLHWDGYQVLLTGDAGPEGLAKAAVYGMKQAGFNPQNLNLLQIPHHGSRHNVSPEILNCLVGPILPDASVQRTAFVSAPKDGGPKHPSRRVLNAFRRRGAQVVWNRTHPVVRFAHNAPWFKPTTFIPAEDFNSTVEEVDE